MSATQPLSSELIALLEHLAPDLNKRFASSVALGARIENLDWLHHVQSFIVPIVESVLAHVPSRGSRVLTELYDVSLELVSAGQFSDAGHSPALVRLWNSVLTQMPVAIAKEPRRIAGSLSNAVAYLSQAAPHCVDRWLDQMLRLTRDCTEPEEALSLGRFVAWTSGLAHGREAALALATRISKPLLLQALELPASTSDADLQRHLTHLAHNPWFGSSKSEDSNIQLVSTCGNFVGFDGPFANPPQVFALDGGLYAHDKVHCWQVFADRFGNSFLKQEATSTTESLKNASATISEKGMIQWSNESVHRPDLADPTSQAFDGTTLAVTIATSYRIYLFARSHE